MNIQLLLLIITIGVNSQENPCYKITRDCFRQYLFNCQEDRTYYTFCQFCFIDYGQCLINNNCLEDQYDATYLYCTSSFFNCTIEQCDRALPKPIIPNYDNSEFLYQILLGLFTVIICSIVVIIGFFICYIFYIKKKKIVDFI